jgi:hypothetical protein
MRRGLIILGLLVGMLVWSAAPALADRRKPTITIGEDPGGVAIRIDTTRTGAGRGSNGRGGGGGGAPCRYALASVGGADSAYVGQPADVGLFSITCGSYTDVRFLRLGPGGNPVIPGPTVDPLQLALSARDQLPVPSGRINANPTRSLVGLPTFYWFEGYDGRPLTKTTSAFGVTVQVQATPTAFRWDFGDGATMTSSDLGRAFPQHSTITHTYQAARPGVTVTCRFEFAVRWRVPGGPWTPLAPLSRAATATLEVAESQTVIGQ